MATTLMDTYMKMTATGFVHSAVQSTINKIMDSKVSCEVNPAYLDNPSDADLNAKHLIAILNEAVNAIFMSTDSCPLWVSLTNMIAVYYHSFSLSISTKHVCCLLSYSLWVYVLNILAVYHYFSLPNICFSLSSHSFFSSSWGSTNDIFNSRGLFVIQAIQLNILNNPGFTTVLVTMNSLLSEVLDHQVAAYVKGDFLSNFLYILIIFKWQIPKDDLSKLNFRW